MSTAQIVTENVLADLDRVLFTTPEAQHRYLERLEARLFGDLMDAKPAQVERLAVAHDLVAAALRNFDPEAHADRVRARNEAR
jgi:non-homologous end joining protein Ku